MPYNSNSYGSKNKTRYALWTLQSWSYHKKYLTKKKIEDLQEQNLTIPREPGGGTGTMASWDTNCIKAILNLCESLVKTSGNRLQRRNIETTFGVQCRYTCDCCERWSTVRNGCVLLIFYMCKKKITMGAFHSTKPREPNGAESSWETFQQFRLKIPEFLNCEFQDILGKK